MSDTKSDILYREETEVRKETSRNNSLGRKKTIAEGKIRKKRQLKCKDEGMTTVNKNRGSR